MSNEQFPKSVISADTVVLYHKGCNDGLASAWAAWTAFGDKASYLPYQYGDEWPWQCKGMHVVMVDLSITAEQYAKIADDIKSLIIIDHHKTAEDLQHRFMSVKSFDAYMGKRLTTWDIPLIYFDLAECGAVLSYRFFTDCMELPLEQMPMALQLVNDYDLWKHKLADSKAFNAWMRNVDVSIASFNTQVSFGDSVSEKVLEIGEALLGYDQSIAKSVVKNYVRKCITNRGVTYALVNGPHHLRNEISDILKDEYDFVVVYNQRTHKTIVSLRGNGSKVIDLSAVAKKYGGGGHHDSASFSFYNDKPVSLLTFADKKVTFMERIRSAINAFKSPLVK